jgi:hypothetical protein
VFTRITSCLARAVAPGLVAIGMTLGLSAAPADAAIGPVTGAKLSVTRAEVGYRVSVHGLVTMTQTEAQGLINSGYKVVVRLWGEDPFSDDLLRTWVLTPVEKYGLIPLWANSQGLAFRISAPVSVHVLNEDTGGCVFDTQDELYAGVRLVTSDGTTIRSAETNRWFGDYDIFC